ncbi:hypothetical protein M5689_024065 [Euphorbia peplus]|nr:hypothetical protein M5689_024065 [Euphorbia peplus]
MEKSKSYPGEYSSSFSGELEPSSYNFNGPRQKGSNNGGFAASNDPELKRKKRIAAYNIFTMERKLKSSVTNSFKWIKNKFNTPSNAPPYGF